MVMQPNAFRDLYVISMCMISMIKDASQNTDTFLLLPAVMFSLAQSLATDNVCATIYIIAGRKEKSQYFQTHPV